MQQTESTTRVLLYSNEPMLAAGLDDILRNARGFELLPPCFTLAALLERTARDAPDLLVLDLTPELTYSALRDLRRRLGETLMLLWVSYIPADLAFQAMGLGVRGILRKTLPVELQVKCLYKVRDGELWFEKSLTDGFLGARGASLTPRETQLVTLLAQGMRNRDIADTLMITEGSVKVYLSRLFQKVGVKDRFELALFGLKHLSASPAAAGGADQRQAPGVFGDLRSFVLEKRAGHANTPEPAGLPSGQKPQFA